MKILLKKVKIVDKSSEFHLKVKDILVVDGVIEAIENEILDDTFDELFFMPNSHISIGWMDIATHLKDPGFEYLEDLNGLQNVALSGGFTEIVGFPNTSPVVQTKESVSFFKNFSKENILQIHNFGAVTKHCLGQDFTDIIDLHHHGVVGFSDGTATIDNSDVFLKSLHYLSSIDSILIHKSLDKNLAMFGQMHEGKISTILGLKGIPAAAEELAIARDLKLLEYLELNKNTSILHFSTISTKGAVEQIRQAKADALPVSCDVAAHQLVFTDEDLMNFDTHLKANPPFRSNDDLDALKEGLADGTIDLIVSDHNPLNEEQKNLEFDLADFGLIGLQTCFSAIIMFSDLELDTIVEKLSVTPRKLLKMELPKIGKGNFANFTIFDPLISYKLDLEHLSSTCKNSPFIGKKLVGKALAVLNNNQFRKL